MTFQGFLRVRASRILSIEGSVTNQGKILHFVQDRPLNSPVRFYNDPARARSRIPLLSNLRIMLSSIKSSGLTFPALGLETASIRLMLLRPAMLGKGFRLMLALRTLNASWRGAGFFSLR